MREMKDSGIEWIGYIPSNWTGSKIKNVCSNIGSGTTPESHLLEYYDGSIPWVQSGDIYGNTKVYNTSVTVSQLAVDSLSALKVYKAPFITMAMYGGSVGNIAISQIDACANQACCCMNAGNDVNIDFLYYWLDFCKQDFLVKAEGGGQPNISQNKIKNQTIFFPNIEEQISISSYLNSKCAEIDAISADIKAEIETLEAYKQSVIAEAVTKGLDKNVAMKDSGMAWLPKLPTHWEIIPSKFLFKNMDARKRSGDEQLTASQKYGIITQADYMERVNAKVVLATQKLNDWKHIEPNDFVISLRSFQGGLEMSETSGCITWHYVVLRSTHKIYPRFYKWLFKSSQYINALQGTCNFIRDGQDLRYSNFAQVPLYIPPLDEQKKIACFLDDKCAEIDNITAYKQEQLTVLADYKKSLIYEYVTGKKEVPEI